MICRQNHSKTAETSKHGLCEVVCYCSVTKSCPTVCDPRDCSTPDFPVFRSFWSLLKIMSIESVILSNHLILCHPLLLPSVFPSIRVFSNESALHNRWPKYWSFSFSISVVVGGRKISERAVRREILKENTEKNLVDGWLSRKKEEKNQLICKAGDFSLVFASIEMFVDELKKVAGEYH